MANKTAFKNLENYFFSADTKKFVVPNYQRGYKWAVKRKADKYSAVEKLVIDLQLALSRNDKYFIQGVTVVEEDNKIILIDGQQRTTTLYFLLYCLDQTSIRSINLEYEIRKESKEFIERLKDEVFEPLKDLTEGQDVFYFKEAIKQIQELIITTKRHTFKEFLLEKVTLLYIIIDKEKATKTFTMMNGSKATMLQEELIKAEFLRCISLPQKIRPTLSTSIDSHLDVLKNVIAQDWDVNALRSRYAREWDKWLYWWNQKTVVNYFNTDKLSILGLLLPYFFKYHTEDLEDQQKTVSLEYFKMLIKDNLKVMPKNIFKKLRDLQKSFEDLYNTPKIYNTMKLALLCTKGEAEKLELIEYFIKNKVNTKLLEDYAKWRLIGVNHKILVNDEGQNPGDGQKEIKEIKAIEALSQLSDKMLYGSNNDLALKQLLRLNVEEDNKLYDGKGRKFDFNIYGEKSLEHIHPKSKVYHKFKDENDFEFCRNGNNEVIELSQIDENWISRDDLNECTEHSIGNLLLLAKNENSKFSNSRFIDKKLIYFNFNLKETFKSRNLLHTISVFSNSEWGKMDIENNQQAFLKRFKEDYNLDLMQNQ